MFWILLGLLWLSLTVGMVLARDWAFLMWNIIFGALFLNLYITGRESEGSGTPEARDHDRDAAGGQASER